MPLILPLIKQLWPVALGTALITALIWFGVHVHKLQTAAAEVPQLITTANDNHAQLVQTQTDNLKTNDAIEELHIVEVKRIVLVEKIKQEAANVATKTPLRDCAPGLDLVLGKLYDDQNRVPGRPGPAPDIPK